MLSTAGISKSFLAKALAYAYHLINSLPLCAIGDKIPLEVWTGKGAQDYDSLWIFGCPTYYHVKEDKLNPRARKDLFRGFKKRIKGYKI